MFTLKRHHAIGVCARMRFLDVCPGKFERTKRKNTVRTDELTAIRIYGSIRIQRRCRACAWLRRAEHPPISARTGYGMYG